MRWWHASSRHPDPQMEAEQQQRHREAVRAFVEACGSGHAQRIGHLLAADVELVVDSGGAFSAPASAATGARPSSEMVVDILARYAFLTLDVHAVNGEPAVLLRNDGSLVGVLMIGMRGDTISHLWVVVNHEKLLRFDVD